MIELWKDIDDFDGLYQVSNLGRVRSQFREGTKGGILKQYLISNYMKVHLYKNGISRFYYVHRLVALAFVPNIENKPQINHINGKKLDNRAVNLEWTTSQENIQHAIDTGLRQFKKVGQFKNGVLINEYLNCRQASKKTGIKYPNIWYVLNKKNKTAGGFEWKYID